MRDRAAALTSTAGRGKKVDTRSEHALVVEPRVLEKSVVLCRQNRLNELLGNLLERDRGALALAELRKQSTVA